MPGVTPGLVVTDRDSRQRLGLADVSSDSLQQEGMADPLGDSRQQEGMTDQQQADLGDSQSGDNRWQLQECAPGDGSSHDDYEEEDDEGGGWINPENFAEACLEMGGALQEPAVGVVVGCVTTDFAMQVCV